MKESNTVQSLAEMLAPYAESAEDGLRRWLVEPDTPRQLAWAMQYCTLDGGKRLRPALVLMAAEAFGHPAGDELALRAATAVEMVHCYSLVHDDLPCMDDDELRRGRPTAHVKFGQAMAVLVGDALLTRAFGVLTEGGHPLASLLAEELARGAGPSGMVAGQVADMGLCDLPEGSQAWDYIHLRKTASLLTASGRMGAICAGAKGKNLDEVTEYSRSLGLAFQLTDDMLDVTGQAEVLGKTPGKDEAGGKATSVAHLGIEQAGKVVEKLTARAVLAAETFGQAGTKLRELARLLSERTH